MLTKIARFVKHKGINVFHVKKELLESTPRWITVGEFGNLGHMAFLGLLAHHDEPGNYSITRKGYDFLAGKAIPLMSYKAKDGTGENGGKGKIIGHSEEMVTIDKFDKEWGAWWHVNGFEVREGRIITEL